jgi:hypothetical protein
MEPMDIDITKKRKYDEGEMPPTKVFVVEFVPMDVDEPAPALQAPQALPDPLIDLFPMPRLVRTTNS